jgi:hypothetical protein
MKRFPQRELRIDERALGDDLGKDNFIFVGSSTDMWADNVPDSWIERVLTKCHGSKENRYLFQTKNPARFRAFIHRFKPNFTLGATIETDKITAISNAPYPSLRAYELAYIKQHGGTDIMISIEPAMKFERNEMLKLIRNVLPNFVSIGADTGNNHLPEPSKEDLEWLICEIRKLGIEVVVKDNLNRLMFTAKVSVFEQSSIRIKDVISLDLALRDSANSFFNLIERNNFADVVQIDFSGVSSISRSFAHQYLQRKNESKKIIKEINLSESIARMFDVVRNSNHKKDIIDRSSVRFIRL